MLRKLGQVSGRKGMLLQILQDFPLKFVGHLRIPNLVQHMILKDSPTLLRRDPGLLEHVFLAALVRFFSARVVGLGVAALVEV